MLTRAFKRAPAREARNEQKKALAAMVNAIAIALLVWPIYLSVRSCRLWGTNNMPSPEIAATLVLAFAVITGLIWLNAWVDGQLPKGPGDTPAE